MVNNLENLILANKIKSIESFFDNEGIDIDTVLNLEEQTPLHIAALNNNKDMVDFFLKKGFFINKTDAQDRSALHIAVLNDDEVMVDFLLKKGADVNKSDINLSTPLHLAAEKGNDTIIRLLVENGASLNEADDAGNTALHYAVSEGNNEAIKALVNFGIDSNKLNYRDISPLHIASEKGDIGIVKFLINNSGAKIDQKDEFGNTALDIAVNRKNEGVVKFLLELEENMDGKNTLEELVDNSEYINIDGLFAERGFDFNVSSENISRTELENIFMEVNNDIHSDNSSISNNLYEVDNLQIDKCLIHTGGYDKECNFII